MRARGRTRRLTGAIGLVGGLLAAPAAGAAAEVAPRCANLAVRDVRPGMTFPEVRATLGTNGVTSRVREAGEELGAIEYSGGGSPVYVLFDRPVDRRSADARVVLVRGEATRRATDAATILKERLGPPDGGSFDASGALATDSVFWVEPACGSVARVYRRSASWWAETAEFVIEVESIDRATRRGAPEAAAIAAEVEAARAEAEKATPPPSLDLALKIVEDKPVDGAASSMVPAKRIRYVAPEYPAAAKALGVRGRVVLLVTVAEDGTVGAIKTLSAQPGGRGFEESAVQAARAWIYNPATRDGKPVPSDVTVVLDFE